MNELTVLREMGHEALLVCQRGARLGIRASEAGFPVTYIQMRGSLDLPAIIALRRFMREQAVDIVNTHSGRDTQLSGMAARSLGLFGGKRPRIVRTRHLALPITSKFSYVTLPDRVTAVPTGIDLSRYLRNEGAGSLRAELGLSAQALLVGTVAILRRKKGHAELLEAVPLVLAKFPDAHFIFAGNGPQQQNLEQRIKELGLNERVHMLGLRQDVVNVLQSLDLFVLPTHQEALGTAFIEAAAVGIPAIGTRVDGVPEAIADGETGLLVPLEDSGAIANAIIALLADPARRRAMGETAQARVQKLYSREVMVRNMLVIYQRLLTKK